MKKKSNWILGISLALPALLIMLFQLLKENRSIMGRWVFGIVAPVEQFLGRMCALVPFSVAEVLTALIITGVLLWLIRAVVRLVRKQEWKEFLHRLLALAALCLWLIAGLDWLWNTAYYAPNFAQRSGLAVRAYSVEELAAVTRLFAQRAGELSAQVERDDAGHFSVSRHSCLKRGVAVYEKVEREFPFLAIKSVRAKPLLCSGLQSILGFTGIYFPFTGEANVNADAPACLFPATIAHEMAHQRMVAAEEEANFVGIAACLTCDDVTFRYSGYLMGLIHLSNALYSADPDSWYDVRATFTQEMVTDWNDNNSYWASLDSTVGEAAEQAYDSFLKGNDQIMGIRSYGACVDLLVAWMGDSL